MSEAVEMLEDAVSPVVLRAKDRTADSIRKLIDQMRTMEMFGDVTDDQAERLARVLEERNGINMGISVNQTDEMKAKQLQLVIPRSLWTTYRSEQISQLMNLADFITLVRLRQ